VLKAAEGLGAKTIIDSSGAALAQALGRGVYLAKPNLRELSQLVGRSLEQEAEWLEAARALVAAGRVEIVALAKEVPSL
jgi:6-phosphofructokinase 2